MPRAYRVMIVSSKPAKRAVDMFFYPLRIERALPISRNRQLHRAIVAQYRFAAVAMAMITRRFLRRRLEMDIHLDVQDALPQLAVRR